MGRIWVVFVVAAVLILGIVILKRPSVRSNDKPVVKRVDGDEKSGRGRTSGSLPSDGPDARKSKPKTAAGEKETTDKLYGLPPLTMENVDINPEKPADMPLEDWEEYERQRYEMVQLKAYKFRETDPEKVVPIEITDALPEAAKKYDVPEDLLAALMYTSSDGGHHDAQHDIEGGYGIMMLKESPTCDSLGEAAQLLGVSKEDVIYNQKLNIMGGAAVLRQYYDDALASGVNESEAWYMAVCQYSGRPDPSLAAALANGVADNMVRGFEIDQDDGSGYFKQDPNPNPLFQSRWKETTPESPAPDRDQPSEDSMDQDQSAQEAQPISGAGTQVPAEATPAAAQPVATP